MRTMRASERDYPVTTAVRFLRERRIDFRPHLYEYEEHGGTRLSASALGIPEHDVIKTLVFETDLHKPLIVLMHGDREVSAKELARTIGVKRIEPCDAAMAQRATGYVFGGTSPFGTRTQLPIFAEKSIFSLSKIYINGGKRGFLVELDPSVLKSELHATEVEVAIQPS
jgi:Cys-tRNA(Pro) deacylase